MTSTQLRPRPPVVTLRGRVQWSDDLISWVEEAVSSGRTCNAVAAEIGCHPKRIYACLHARRNFSPVPVSTEERDDFAALMDGRRFEDVQLRRAGTPSRGLAPVGPITRIIPRRPVGRALDLGGV